MREDEAWEFSLRAAQLLEECRDQTRRARILRRAMETLGDSAWRLPFVAAVIVVNKCPLKLRDKHGRPSSALLLPDKEKMPSNSMVASLLREVFDDRNSELNAATIRRRLTYAAGFVESMWDFLADPEAQELAEVARSCFRGLATEPHGIEHVAMLYLSCLDVINGFGTTEIRPAGGGC